jgi:hypothetical protein
VDLLWLGRGSEAQLVSEKLAVERPHRVFGRFTWKTIRPGTVTASSCDLSSFTLQLKRLDGSTRTMTSTRVFDTDE